MDDSLRLIQHLYGETVDDETFPRRLAEDEALQQEFDDLQAIKDALDRRSSPSPDPDVVDSVVDRAGHAARGEPFSEPQPAADRSPRAPRRGWTRRLQGVSAALAVLLVVGLAWWQLPADTTGPTARKSAGQQPEATTQADAEGNVDAVPEWDDSDEVVRLHQRIEALQTRSRSDAWGGDLQPASQTRP